MPPDLALVDVVYFAVLAACGFALLAPFARLMWRLAGDAPRHITTPYGPIQMVVLRVATENVVVFEVATPLSVGQRMQMTWWFEQQLPRGTRVLVLDGGVRVVADCAESHPQGAAT